MVYLRKKILMAVVTAIFALIVILPAVASAATVDWTRQFGTSTSDYGQGVATDGSGNVYVTGFTGGTLPGQSSSGSADAYVRKYDAAGNELWTRQFGTSSIDYGYSVAIDGSGNIYVTGNTYGTLPGQSSAGGFDAFVRKYDATGNELWTRQFGTSASDYGYSVVTDGGGNVYISGYTSGTLPGQSSAGSFDAFVRKYDATGSELWTRQFGTVTEDRGQSIAVDTSGNVYLSGYTGGTLPGQSSSGGRDAYVRKYDTSGTELWTRQFGTSANDYGYGVATDGGGNAYISGYTEDTLPDQSSLGGRDAFVRKYDAAGSELWTRQFGTPNSDVSNSVATDAGGNVYVTGFTGGTLPGQSFSGSFDTFIRKYDASGTELWTNQFGTSGADLGRGVATDAGGNVYISGYTYGTLPGQSSAGNYDAFVRKYKVAAGAPATGLDTYSLVIVSFIMLIIGSGLLVRQKKNWLFNKV